MANASVHINLVNSYFALLKGLAPEAKKALIARLAESIVPSKTKNDASWEALFGAWELDQSTEIFLDDLKKDRSFTRKDLEL